MTQLLVLIPVQAVPEAGAPTGSSMQQLLVMGLSFLAIMYFLVIRPEGKLKKKRQAMLDAMKKGDEIVLTSGIHGSVAAIHEDIVTVQVDEGVRLKVSRNSVAEIKPGA